jgi:DNA mismatch repair protein MSH6
VEAINARLDAVDDLMSHPDFVGQFTQLAKGLPDLERLVSRIHAGNIKQSDFLKVMESYRKLQAGIDMLGNLADSFEGNSVSGLLRGAPDMHQHLKHIGSLYSVETTEKTIAIMPTEGADEECDEANAEVARVEAVLDDLLQDAKRLLKAKDLKYWHSAQGGKEIFQIQVPAGVKVPRDWTKVGSTKAFNRYVTPETLPVIREIQEARETQSTAKKGFFRHLLGEFDKERSLWLNTIRVFAELDCLVSLSKASAMMDEPKCRPTFVNSDSAFVDFAELRHASMSLRTDNFIPNDVALGGTSTVGNESEPNPRQVLLTGPNMAGKSTLLRMTAAGLIMAQLGCYVPAREAKLSPVDKIQTRMGAYDSESECLFERAGPGTKPDTGFRLVSQWSPNNADACPVQTCSLRRVRSRSSSTSVPRSSARLVRGRL